MGNVVSLVRSGFSSTEITQSLAKSIEMIDFKIKEPVKTVILKVNLCFYCQATTGHTTDPQLVGALIDYVRERWGGDVEISIAEADATSMRTKYAFAMLGYERLAVEKKVHLVNLSNDVLDDKAFKINGHVVKLKIPRSLMTSDLFINVPKLKTHALTGITCALKNIYGCNGIRRKTIYHSYINETLVAINRELRSHLTVVDGLVALGSCPVKLGLIMASTDGFSIDCVAARILGYNPSRLSFLNFASKEKIGNSRGICTVGEDIDLLKKLVPQQGFRSKPLWLKTMKRGMSLYEKITGDIIPPEFKLNDKS